MSRFDEAMAEAARLADPRRTAVPARIIEPGRNVDLSRHTTQVAGVRVRGADVARLRLRCGVPNCDGEFPIVRGPGVIDGRRVIDANIDEWHLAAGIWRSGRTARRRRNRVMTAARNAVEVTAEMLGRHYIWLPMHFACPACGQVNLLK